jgi:hypothetical protein
MTYTVEDLTELIRHHLVLSVENDEIADDNLAHLMRRIDQMITTPHRHEDVYWMGCEQCGTWVSSELIGADGAGESEDGGFYCTSCRFGEEDV